MTGHQQLGVLAAHLLTALSVILSATVLAALHDLDAQTVAVIYGTAIGLIGGSAGTVAALGGVTNGKSQVATHHLDQLTTAATGTPTPSEEG